MAEGYGRGILKIVGAGSICLCVLWTCLLRADAQIRIAACGLEGDALIVFVSADTNLYYILRRGDAVTSISLAVDIALGEETNPAGLVDFPLSAQPGPAGFYVVHAVPVTAPLDTDADGIDDVFELGLAILDPLNGADAGGDADGDGVTNLREYRQGRDLLRPSVLGDIGTVGLVVYRPAAG